MEKRGGLCITRRSRQGIRIADNIWVYVKEKVNGSRNQVQIVIWTPEGIPVVREELLEEKGPLFDLTAYTPHD